MIDVVPEAIDLKLPDDVTVKGFLYRTTDLAYLREDLLEIDLPNGLTIDVGWYPEGDLNGGYLVVLYRDSLQKQVVPSTLTPHIDEAVRVIRTLCYGYTGDAYAEYKEHNSRVEEYYQECLEREQRAARIARRRRELRSTFPCPGLITDTTFLTGTHADDGFGNDEMSRGIAYRRAREAGVTPSGKYISQIADSLGDPKAWVNSRAEVKGICEREGFSCEGAGIKVKAREPDIPDPFDSPYQVAPDIVQDAVKKELDGEQVGTQERRDLEEKFSDLHSGR